MTDRFADCLAFTLQYEGGDSNDPRDPGGATRNGITQATYDAWRKGSGRVRQSVFRMTGLERDAIYLANYWNEMRCGTLATGVDLVVFDASVNSGTARARRWLRASIGGESIATIKRICAKRLSFVEGLRTFAIYGKGWRTRVAACEATALAMAAGEGAPRILAAEARTATSKAATARTMTKASASSGVGAGLVSQSTGGHGWLTAAILLTVAAGVVILIIQRKNQEARAQALTAAARSSAPAAVTMISATAGAIAGGANA